MTSRLGVCCRQSVLFRVSALPSKAAAVQTLIISQWK